MTSFDYDLLVNLMVVHAIATISPGPNFMLVFQEALRGVAGKSLGALVLGIGMGSLVQSSAALIGVSAILQESELAFSFIRGFGACYLAYLGYRSILAFVQDRWMQASGEAVSKADGSKSATGTGDAARLRTGFLASLLNPKAFLYFSSVLPQFLTPGVSKAQLLCTPPSLFLITVLWFSCVGVLVGRARRQPLITRAKAYLSLCVGLFFIWLAGSQAFALSQFLVRA